MSSLIADPTGQALAAALDLRHRRQELLAGNLANVDTPGYQPVDLAFEGRLQEALAAADAHPPGFVRTAAAHLDAAVPMDPASADVVVRPDVTNTLDGNGVDLDLEMARFADNAVRYEVTVEATRKRIGMLVNLIAQLGAG